MLTGIILVWASCSKHSGQKTDAAATDSDGSRATNGGNGGASGALGAAGAGGTKDSGAVRGGGAGTGAASAIDLDASVLERNKHPSRDGHFVQPTLTKAMAAKMAPDQGFLALFKGAMYASPLYLANGRGGKGVFFAVTTGNDVYALDETTGAVVWMHNVGPSPVQSGAGCGNVKPVGIISTPVIDPASRTIYVGAAVGTNAIERHEIHALSVDDGAERANWPIDVSKVKAAVAFNPPVQNQRSALSLVGGILYVAYGGHAGDCGAYRGWVVAIDTKNPASAAAWTTGGVGEGIWPSGGMASDGNGVFALTGNSIVGTAIHFDSEEVVHLTGLGNVDRNTGVFWPTTWRGMDAADADLGASSPVYIEVPGGTPSTLLAAVSKDGHLYLLDSKNLGGMGGQVVDQMVSTGAMSIHTALASYTTTNGRYVVLTAGSGAICNGGVGRAVVSVQIVPGAPPTAKTAFCAPSNGSGAPIATTTDGAHDAIVWFQSGGKLVGVDGDTGATIFDGGAGSCDAGRPWTSPIAVNGRIVVSGDGHLCSWSPH